MHHFCLSLRKEDYLDLLQNALICSTYPEYQRTASTNYNGPSQVDLQSIAVHPNSTYWILMLAVSPRCHKTRRAGPSSCAS